MDFVWFLWQAVSMSIYGIGGYSNTIALPSALESGREGISRATEVMARSAEEVAGVIVELSSDGESSGAQGMSLDGALLDTKVAEYMALANIRVVQTASHISEEAMSILGSSE